MKHYGLFHGTFDRVLRDMGLLDTRQIVKTGVKFPRPRLERTLMGPGPNDNIALELARTAAIWSGAAKEEEDVLHEIAALKELERKVELAEKESLNKAKEQVRIIY